MSRYTKDDIFRMVEEEDVEFIRLQFTDIFGTLKNIAITSSQLEKALDNKCMFDGSSVEGFVRIEESDMYLYPDYDTFEIFPWRPQQGKVARLICDVYTPDGKPFEGDPRWILKKTIKEANEMGYRFDVGPECEFFLFHTDDNGLPTTLSHEKAGYFDLGPNDLGENIRRDMVLTLEEMGFEIGDYITVSCEDGKLVITPDAEKAAMAKAEAEFMEKGMKKLQKRFQAEKEQLHAQFVAERNTEYNGREVQ